MSVLEPKFVLATYYNRRLELEEKIQQLRDDASHKIVDLYKVVPGVKFRRFLGEHAVLTGLFEAGTVTFGVSIGPGSLFPFVEELKRDCAEVQELWRDEVLIEINERTPPWIDVTFIIATRQ